MSSPSWSTTTWITCSRFRKLNRSVNLQVEVMATSAYLRRSQRTGLGSPLWVRVASTMK